MRFLLSLILTGWTALSFNLIVPVSPALAVDPIIYDNGVSVLNSSWASFERADIGWSTADDIEWTIAPGDEVIVTGIEWTGAWFQESTSTLVHHTDLVQAFEIHFLLDDGTGTAPVGSPATVAASAIASYNVTAAPISISPSRLVGYYQVADWTPLVMTRGTRYWVVIRAINPAIPTNHWRWLASADDGNSRLGGNCFGCESWFITGGNTQDFRLLGTISGEPPIATEISSFGRVKSLFGE